MLLGVAFAAAPTAARAADTPMCVVPSGAFDASYQERLGPLITEGMWVGGDPTPRIGPGWQAATTVLGGQFVMHRLDPGRQGWAVAFSPGQYDASTGRAAIAAYLAEHASAADAAYLLDTLLLQPTPYSKADLDAVFAQVGEIMRTNAGLFSSAGVGCLLSDGVRVEVSVGTPDTPERRAQAEALLAPFGDKVRVVHGVSWAQAAVGQVPGIAEQSGPGQRPTLKVRDYVTLPRTSRCARTVGAKARSGADVKRVRLAIGKRVSAGKHPRLKLKSKRSKVTVTVTLRDGTTAIENLTYRRCA